MPTISRINDMKQTYYDGRSKLRLSEIEDLMKKHRIIVPPLSRRTLTKMCEEGAFETAGGKPTSFGWLVYEDSFWNWARKLNEGTTEDAKDEQIDRHGSN